MAGIESGVEEMMESPLENACAGAIRRIRASSLVISLVLMCNPVSPLIDKHFTTLISSAPWHTTHLQAITSLWPSSFSTLSFHLPFPRTS